MNQMSESAVTLALSRITVATTLHQWGKTNLSHDAATLNFKLNRLTKSQEEITCENFLQINLTYLRYRG